MPQQICDAKQCERVLVESGVLNPAIYCMPARVTVEARNMLTVTTMEGGGGGGVQGRTGLRV